MALEIEATDVIKIILQFLKENSLTESFETLQRECGVSLNAVEDAEAFYRDVTAGRWAKVLRVASGLSLPLAKQEALYEQVFLELVELKETDLARGLLQQPPLGDLKISDAPRHRRLESLCAQTWLSLEELYGAQPRERRRAALAQALRAEVRQLPPARLPQLLGCALRWLEHRGGVAPGVAYDLARGCAGGAVADEVDAPVKVQAHRVAFGGDSCAESAAWAADGRSLATGSSDGFVEIWDAEAAALRRDLSYQAQDRCLMHASAVLSVAFSRRSDLLASADEKGTVKVWAVARGECLRAFDGAHSQGVTSVCFSADDQHVLSASFDGLIRIHGMKSGRLLKEFRGHTSFVNQATYLDEDATILSCAADGTVRLWDAVSCECLFVLKPPKPSAAAEPSVNAVAVRPGVDDQVLVCSKTSECHLMRLTGQVIKTYSPPKDIPASDLVSAKFSPRGDFVYALFESGHLVSFGAESGAAEAAAEVCSAQEAVGFVHHPLRNLVTVFASDGSLTSWKAE